ncbi:P-loop containing nucleoside triphosphate hydrolase protein [Coniophora puteana RWD-64-598 SS2]|uniref:RNA helicase n=1 Tax=Coniophora puteana (strain RWD-64-598) TaxID=741705 RepID=R7SF21_CONPW|nr:P-loop containing nucleoside triphosphate hydrolase protein [Coniophora puteana RWD-64-598 SS2]EIW74342.1 P-loop containing nucleoside triphosphate hydrolase protein [Coniophora puteana RWD-64-598 SS2]
MELYHDHSRSDEHVRALQNMIAQEQNILPSLPPRSPPLAAPPTAVPFSYDGSRPTTSCDLFQIAGQPLDDGEGLVIDFGVVEMDSSIRAEDSTVRNLLLKTSDGRFNLIDLPFVSASEETATSNTRASFTATVGQQSRVVRPNVDVPVVLRIVAFGEGLHKDKFEIEVHDFSSQTSHLITLTVRAVVGSRADYDILNSRRRHGPPPAALNIAFAGPSIRNVRPDSWTAPEWKVKLPHYPVPGSMRAMFESGELTAGVFGEEFMPKPFDITTYAKHFGSLTYLSELFDRRELARHGLAGMSVQSRHPYYYVPIPGIADRRPKLHVGDYIRVKKAKSSAESPDFEGRIVRIERAGAVVSFSDRFRAPQGEKFDVQFKFNTMPYRRQHRALEFVSEFPRFLFPEPDPGIVPEDIQVELPRTSEIAGNFEQSQAIRAIVRAPPGSSPFIIFGPPGTGKTSTVVQTIHQLLAKSPDVRVLACSPQNSSADHIAIKLAMGPAQLDTKVLFRLNALWRGRGQENDALEADKYPRILDPYSEINEHNVFAFPEKEKLASFRVVVSTCSSAGVAEGLGIPRGHFTHIIIDEAVQSVEPETLAAILPLADEHTNIVLAGDPKQLPPSCHSNVAKEFGLHISYLQRLIGLPLYSNVRDMNGSVIMLRENFRSHPAIMHVSNQIFYEGELRPMGNPDIHMFEDAPFVEGRFPVVFHSVIGEEKRDKGSPSYYNNSEAVIVKRYCQMLIEGYTVGEETFKIAPEDIGIISPYHAQRYAINDLCGWEGLKIGTVESFQGQERRVIIVSTVRTRRLGFMSEPQRMNVALTRARALLIVVGNPLLLCRDPHWRSFLLYTSQHSGWRGNPRPETIPGLSEEVIQARNNAMLSNQRSDKARAEAEALLARFRAVTDVVPPPVMSD